MTLRKKFCAGSGYFALEALARANIDPEESAAGLDSGSVSTLTKTMAELAAEIENGGTGATILFGGDSLPKDIFPVKMIAGGLSMEHEESIDDAM